MTAHLAEAIYASKDDGSDCRNECDSSCVMLLLAD
jgi:hypothetical protein